MRIIFKYRMIQAGLMLVSGLFFGWLIFGGSDTETIDHKNELTKETIWTCSMHPQIRQNEPGKCPICGMDLIPLVSGRDDGVNSSFIYTMSPEAIAMANVQTAKISYEEPEYEVYLTGKIEANETKLKTISANFSGRIEKLFIDFTGQAVNKGERLATIYSPELVTAQKELIEAAKHRETNPNLYTAVKEKLRLWNLTENQIAQIEFSGEVMTEFDVYAVNSGIVIHRNVLTGDYINRGNVLFEIADLSSVWVILDAYESDLAFVRVGAKVNFSVASFPGKEFTSTVKFIDPLINPQTRTTSVRAEANNPGLQLKPDMFVRGKIKTLFSNSTRGKSKAGKSLLAPRTSILWTGTRSVVYVKVPDSESPAFEMREVILGPRAGDFYVVENGLQEGEEIVTNGVFAIDAAAQLSGNYSMMNRPESKRIMVPDKFKSQLSNLTKHYFELKNSLVDSDFPKTKNNAGKVLQVLNSIDVNLLENHTFTLWMKQDNMLRKSIKMISEAKSLDEQRKHFEPLSDAIIQTADIFGLTIELVFVQFCPMAFDNKGAYWLSESDEILNPYFGEAMLRCGEIKKKINSVDSYEDASQIPQKIVEHQH